ncbi:MAG: 2,3-diaminopropionate biosynthesis protein SbnB [Terriglobales bacterium]
MQADDSLAILTARDVASLLNQREREIMRVIEAAYSAHARGGTNCPHSLFLHPPQPANSRIIALPAYIGEETNVAGVKWISSFPSNLAMGLPRASALIVLNSVETGRAYAVMEGAIISKKRTSASAAIAASRLIADPQAVNYVGIIGCGEINREVLEFLSKTLPSLALVRVFDTSTERAQSFRAFCEDRFNVEALSAKSIDEVLGGGQVISIATTALEPHIQTLAACPPSTVILHLSLRDLAPHLLHEVDNVVDDVDHVCRANTSLDLATQKAGHRRCIRTTLGEILNGFSPSISGDGRTVVFSPFGLGILDLSLAAYVYKAAMSGGQMEMIPGFHAAASV